MPLPAPAPRSQPFAFTEAWLLDAIALVSEVILEHGAKYAPVLDRLERELETLKQQDDPVSRARRHLARAQAAATHVAASPAPAR